MYHVVGTDGQTYDQADEQMLRRLAAEAKLTPQTPVLDLVSGLSAPADQMLHHFHLFDAMSAPPSAPIMVPYPPAIQMVPGSVPVLVEADLGARFVGCFIDALISLPLGFMAGVPFLGIVAAPALCAYWLLRDSFYGGQSIGKRIAKTRVVFNDGRPITRRESCLRNIAYLSSIILMIPFIGELGFGFLGCLGILDVILVLTTRRRLGDNFAGTKVVQEFARS